MTAQALENKEREISRNHAAFQKMSFSSADKGKFALLHNGELVEVVDSRLDAHKAGARKFADGVYSIQEIMPRRKDLGYLSHALL